MHDFRQLRVALVHYWLVNRRGGERVLEALAEMFPQADIFTLVLDPKTLSPQLRSHKIATSFLQRLPGARRHYRKLLPFFPLAVEQLRLRDYDLVISSESGPAKGVITSSHTCHICYCHSPMRYLWDMYHTYREGRSVGPVSRLIFDLSAHYVRLWDVATASRVDHFVANSENVARRIRKHYRRDARVIYPPVDVSAGYLADSIEDYYLVASPLVDYKRVDLAIEAANRLKRPLRVIGDGEEAERLRRLAGATVSFLGYVSDDVLRDNYAHARALLYPGEEDFGMVPVEAQSFGRPVIAYARGGAVESVNGFLPGDTLDSESATGIFFTEQSVDSLVEAIERFESMERRFSPARIQTHAQGFGVTRFQAEMRAFIEEALAEFRSGRPQLVGR
ncbi:MAG TPA: glycosyltransferase [Terriglobia bacterium]|nr:glycosyltransferase [Terriglobia bacterium]